MKVIAISGGSCTGKSTVINALKDAGYQTDSLKVARSVMEATGITPDMLADAAKSGNRDLIIRFQENLYKTKREHDLMLASVPSGFFVGDFIHPDVIFVERSLVDLYGFAFLWHDTTSDFARWLETYRNALTTDVPSIYHKTIILPYGALPYDNDGVRLAASDSDASFLHRIITHEALLVSPDARIVQSTGIDDRVNEILAYCGLN